MVKELNNVFYAHVISRILYAFSTWGGFRTTALIT